MSAKKYSFNNLFNDLQKKEVETKSQADKRKILSLKEEIFNKIQNDPKMAKKAAQIITNFYNK